MAIAMSYCISVRHPQNDNLEWNRDLSYAEYERLRGQFHRQPNFDGLDTGSGDLFTAILTPIRTNNLKNFCVDFFLPATINQALKTYTIAVKVFAVIGALVLDVLTLPIRLVTCIPRCIYNALRPENPFHMYLREQGVDDGLVDLGFVNVSLYFFPDSRQTTGMSIINRDLGLRRIVYFMALPEWVTQNSF